MKKELIAWMKSHRVHTAAAAVLIIGAFSVSVAAASGAFLPEESGTTGGKAPSRVMEITAKELGRAIHAHPTLGEAMMEAAHAVHGECAHMPTRKKR